MDYSSDTKTGFGRRALLRHLVALGAAGAWLLPGLGGVEAWAAKPAKPAKPAPPGWPPNKANVKAVTVSPHDPSITASDVTYPGIIIGTVGGYFAAPAGGEIYPGILVIHDYLGLTEHIRDVARRLALLGYAALAPDLLSQLGGMAKVGDQAHVIAALQSLSQADYANALNASVRYLEARPQVSKIRIGALGFGLGGNLIWLLIGMNRDVKAGVLFDAQVPDPSVAAQMTVPLLYLCGADDKAANDGLKAFDAAMEKAGAAWEFKVEPKADRGFFDDSRTTYVAAAATDAWKLTLGWFGKYLQH